MITSIADVRTLEYCALNAWPAYQTVVLNDWIVRLAGGYTKRANSANAIQAGAQLEGLVEKIEALYAHNRLPTIFRVSPLAALNTDHMLSEAGYVAFDPSVVMVMDQLPAGGDDRVTIEEMPSDSWLNGFARANDVSDQQRAIHDNIITSIAWPSAFASLVVEGEVVGYGLAVLEHSVLGLFDIGVVASRRRQGHGRALVTALLAWGLRKGAARAYLQVREQNEGALRLYKGLGFAKAYSYHYRVPNNLHVG